MPVAHKPTRAELAGLNVDALLDDHFRHFAEPARTLLFESRRSASLRTPTFDVPHLARWSRGRALLIGDAAHAMSSAGGQGVSMALEDAVVLARALASTSGHARVTDALVAFERRRRRRLEPLIEQAHANDVRSYTPSSTPWPLTWLTERVFALMSGFIAGALARTWYVRAGDVDPLAAF